ncbi:hypothetical protein ZWY2020_045563 [Hordeum vulgare]|nr:hypothetical protein ZWY2020_045563 [Hordeum vulgare]
MKGALVAGNATVGDVIKAGFLVRSKANIGWCGECQAAGGSNRYDGGVSDDHTCFCSSGQASGSCPTTSSGSGSFAIALVMSALLIVVSFQYKRRQYK